MAYEYLLTLLTSLRARLAREDGQTMAEYGILLGVIVLVAAAAALIFGDVLLNLFNKFDAYISLYAPWRAGRFG